MNFGWIRPLVARTRQAIIRNAPHLLMGFGTAGSVTAVIFAAQATPKAHEALIQAADEKDGKLTLWEKTKAAGPIYIPAAGMEIFSLICFWSAHGIDVKRQALLAGLYSTAETALQEYQKKVTEMIGKEGETEIRKAIGQDRIDQNPPPATVILDGDTDRWCIYDDQYFRSNWYRLKEAQNLANAEMIRNLYLSKTELKWLLDPDKRYLRTDGEDGQVGWSVDRLMEFDIQSGFGRNHEPVLILEIRDENGNRYEPVPGFSRGL